MMAQFIKHIRNYSLPKIEWGWRRPSLLPQLEINFKFCINVRTFSFVIDRDYTTLLRIERGPLSKYFASAAVGMLAGPFSCDDEVRKAVGKAMADSLGIGDIECRNLIELMLEEVREKFESDNLPESGVFDVDIELLVKSSKFYVVARDDDHHHHMVPPADSSIELLEKCEVDCVTSCSICMEDLGGSDACALRMPCSHVFHGSCIHKWLKTSHYCPLCRYEMPTAV